MLPYRPGVQDRFPLETFQTPKSVNNGLRRLYGRAQPSRPSPLIRRRAHFEHFHAYTPVRTPSTYGRVRIILLSSLFTILLLLVLHGLHPDCVSGYLSLSTSILPRFRAGRVPDVITRAYDNMTRDLDLIKSHLNLGDLSRDFALRGNGAHILSEITSPTYRATPGMINKFLHRSTEQGRKGWSSSIILEEQLVIGDCWEIQETQGHVGILLSAPVKVTEVAISYAHPDLISPYDAGKAPRNIILWVLTDPSDLTTLHPHYPNRLASTFSTMKRLPLFIDQSAIFVPLIYGTYNISAKSPIQRFRNIGLDLQFPVQAIILEVIDNWGSNTTCLYHVGVRGDPI